MTLEHETIQMVHNVEHPRISQGAVESVGKLWLQVKIIAASLHFCIVNNTDNLWKRKSWPWQTWLVHHLLFVHANATRT